MAPPRKPKPEPPTPALRRPSRKRARALVDEILARGAYMGARTTPAYEKLALLLEVPDEPHRLLLRLRFDPNNINDPGAYTNQLLNEYDDNVRLVSRQKEEA